MKWTKFNQTIRSLAPYRQKQLFELLFNNLLDKWDQATNIPAVLKKELNENCPIETVGTLQKSSDKQSFKALITLEDNEKIETVLMQSRKGRNTVCLSSQVGCTMNCAYCATGGMGFKRNLTELEMAEQLLFWKKFLKEKNKHVDNVVFMGMGEPFANYDNFIKAVEIINDKKYFNIGARKISVSTCGIIDGIKKLSREPKQINLAISLHASNDKLRSEIMPINKEASIKKILLAVDNYIEKTNRKVMFEYLLLSGINDEDEHAEELILLMDKPLYVINLVTYNPTGKFKRSSKFQTTKFRNILETAGLNVTQRHSFGSDIDAACGQLAGK
ncbi:23S rRNA (adenine(2503)-C(2))-methyltransferase RlmN [Candidatus Kuenenbacteria bacterium]|nr:23S rRNA (adenine(2503)-C(2))-methyltransferase RlmN [Candidatus Kuenenbacteria bacterium]